MHKNLPKSKASQSFEFSPSILGIISDGRIFFLKIFRTNSAIASMCLGDLPVTTTMKSTYFSSDGNEATNMSTALSRLRTSTNSSMSKTPCNPPETKCNYFANALYGDR